jgi:hypothetical protein
MSAISVCLAMGVILIGWMGREEHLGLFPVYIEDPETVGQGIRQRIGVAPLREDMTVQEAVRDNGFSDAGPVTHVVRVRRAPIWRASNVSKCASTWIERTLQGAGLTATAENWSRWAPFYTSDNVLYEVHSDDPWNLKLRVGDCIDLRHKE